MEVNTGPTRMYNVQHIRDQVFPTSVGGREMWSELPAGGNGTWSELFVGGSEMWSEWEWNAECLREIRVGGVVAALDSRVVCG